MLAQKITLPETPRPSLYLIPLGEEEKKICFEIQKHLRQFHIATETDVSNRKLNKAMSVASQKNARFVAVIGDEELKTGLILLKDMDSKETFSVPFNSLKRILQVESQANHFIDITKEMTKPFDHESESDFFFKRLSKNIQNTSQLTQQLQEALVQMQSILEKQ